jgi:carbonic anhydrase
MFPDFRPREKPTPMNEHHAFGRHAAFSCYGSNHIHRRGILGAGFQHLRSAAKEARGDLAKAVEINVRNQAIILAESSPVIARLVREKKLIIAGGVYDLSTGKVARVDLPKLESGMKS